MENGLHQAACNRTGPDRTMDCRPAVSCLIDSQGEIRFEGRSQTGQTFLVHLPLGDEGRLEQRQRQRRLASRRLTHYADCYLNLQAFTDLTAFYQLP